MLDFQQIFPDLCLFVKKISSGLLIIAITFGCQSQTSNQEPIATTSPIHATETTTPSPIPTVTPTLIYQPDPVSFENSGEWRFTKPYVFKDWPELIVPDGDTFKLIDGLKVESIELSYQWFGHIDDIVSSYKQIRRIGDTYKLAGEVVLEEKIENLVNSIKDLHLVPQTVSSYALTDDYPIWAIEITSENGERILLTSRSNSIPFAPWNIIYNGHVYAQYDGDVFAPLVDLFKIDEDQAMTYSFYRNLERDVVIVNSNRLPSPLNDGFLGLLIMHRAIDFEANASAGEIIGTLNGPISINRFRDSITGFVTDLKEVTLEKNDHSKVNCSIKTLENEYNPSSVKWSFICPAEAPNVVGSYLYSVKLSFRTDKGERVTSEGILFGDWNRGILIPQVVFPPEIQKILDSYEPYNVLRKNHEILLLGFDAKVDIVKGRLDDAFSADILLLGQVAWGGMTIPYTLMTSLSIENGNIVRWDIDPYELQTLLTDVLRQPITRNILNHEQDAVLNLYYYESNNGADIEYSFGSILPGKHSTRVTPCEGVPWREELPDKNTPLRGFDFNRNWEEFWVANPQFVFIDGGIRALEFNDGPIDYGDSSMKFLLPDEFRINGGFPLDISGSFDLGPYISISWPYDATQEDRDVYFTMIEQLPGTKEFRESGVKIDDVIFVINDEGTFDIVDCR